MDTKNSIQMDTIKKPGVYSWEISESELQYQTQIGRGAFGVVMKATWYNNMGSAAFNNITGEINK
jgi:hypothetical protein